MISQMTDVENLSLQLERELERYQQEYKIKDGDMAWILLRVGTCFYLKDLCSRGFNGNGNGHLDLGKPA
ncbi:MAG: hypothetical protein A2144_15030 [Chloroflexi bacterium RBG_16_50_9]|nr:MAG: hypothetical protein A2144_15030 [Chloroflexi bacterium RBG_16_50_9]